MQVVQLAIGLMDVSLELADGALVATPMPWGTRVTGFWQDGDLVAARRELAAVLERVPPETSTRDLLTGKLASAAEAVARLSATPTVANVFYARHTIIEGRVWARLFGCYTLGEPDLVVMAEADVDVQRVYEVLTRWAQFRLGDGRDLDLTRPIPYGYWFLGTTGADIADAEFWSALRDQLDAHHLRQAFDERMVTPAPRIIIEADRVAVPEVGEWLVGASRALRVTMQQRATLERAGLDMSGQSRWAPSAHDAAGFCDRLDPKHCDALFAYREHPQSDADSGWRFACLDEDHVHDETSLQLAPLWRLTEALPELVRYFALPPGWVVAREESAWWLRPPNDTHTYKDELAPGSTDGPAQGAG